MQIQARTYHASPKLFPLGTILHSGEYNTARYILEAPIDELDDEFKCRRIVEESLENHRLQRTDCLPSRKDSLFLCLTKPELLRWAGKAGRQHKHELSSRRINKIIAADVAWYDFMTSMVKHKYPEDMIHFCAACYWSGIQLKNTEISAEPGEPIIPFLRRVSQEPPGIEILAQGRFEVTGIIE